jgi:hypothetical protein
LEKKTDKKKFLNGDESPKFSSNLGESPATDDNSPSIKKDETSGDEGSIAIEEEDKMREESISITRSEASSMDESISSIKDSGKSSGEELESPAISDDESTSRNSINDEGSEQLLYLETINAYCFKAVFEVIHSNVKNGNLIFSKNKIIFRERNDDEKSGSEKKKSSSSKSSNKYTIVDVLIKPTKSDKYKPNFSLFPEGEDEKSKIETIVSELTDELEKLFQNEINEKNIGSNTYSFINSHGDISSFTDAKRKRAIETHARKLVESNRVLTVSISTKLFRDKFVTVMKKDSMILEIKRKNADSKIDLFISISNSERGKETKEKMRSTKFMSKEFDIPRISKEEEHNKAIRSAEFQKLFRVISKCESVTIQVQKEAIRFKYDETETAYGKWKPSKENIIYQGMFKKSQIKGLSKFMLLSPQGQIMIYGNKFNELRFCCDIGPIGTFNIYLVSS